MAYKPDALSDYLYDSCLDFLLLKTFARGDIKKHNNLPSTSASALSSTIQTARDELCCRQITWLKLEMRKVNHANMNFRLVSQLINNRFQDYSLGVSGTNKIYISLSMAEELIYKTAIKEIESMKLNVKVDGKYGDYSSLLNETIKCCPDCKACRATSLIDRCFAAFVQHAKKFSYGFRQSFAGFRVNFVAIHLMILWKKLISLENASPFCLLDIAENRSKLRRLIDYTIENKISAIPMLTEEQLTTANRNFLVGDNFYSSALVHFVHKHQAWRISAGASSFGQFFDKPTIFDSLTKIRHQFLRKVYMTVDLKSIDCSSELSVLYSNIDPNLALIHRPSRREVICQTMAEELLWAVLIPLCVATCDLDHFLNNPLLLHLFVCLRYHGLQSSWILPALKRLNCLLANKKVLSIERMESIRKEYFTTRAVSYRAFYRFMMAKHSIRLEACLLDTTSNSHVNGEINNPDTTTKADDSNLSEPSIRLNDDYLLRCIRKTAWPCQEKIHSMHSDMLSVRNICMSLENLFQRQALRYFLRDDSLSSVSQDFSCVPLDDVDLKWNAFWDIGLLSLKRRYLNDIDCGSVSSDKMDIYVDRMFKFFDLNYQFTDRRRAARSRFFDLLNEMLLRSNRCSSPVDFSALDNLIDLLRHSRLKYRTSKRLLEDSTKLYLDTCISIIDYWKHTNAKLSQSAVISRSTEASVRLIGSLTQQFKRIQPMSPRLLEICLLLTKSDENVAYTTSDGLENLLVEHLRTHPFDVKAFELLFQYFPDNQLIKTLVKFHPSHQFIIEYCRRLLSKIDDSLETFESLFNLVYQYLDFKSNSCDANAWRIAQKLTMHANTVRVDKKAETFMLNLKNGWLERSDWWPKFHLNPFFNSKSNAESHDALELLNLKRSVLKHCSIVFER